MIICMFCLLLSTSRYLILNTLMHADMVIHQHMKILLIRYIVPEKRLATADNFFCLKWCMYDV